MASGPGAFPSTKEGTNYARLCRLLVDVGTQVLRDTFDKIHFPSNLHVTLKTDPALTTLQLLRKKRVLYPSQWDKLYPPATTSPSVSSTNFDITLLSLLLRHICHLSPPASTGNWHELPPVSDNSTEANIARIKYYRNNVAHISQASVSDSEFNGLWHDISNALLALGSGPSYATVISRLKTECMDPDVDKRYRELLKEWKKDDDSIKEKLEELQETLNELKSDEGSGRNKRRKIEDDFNPAELIDGICQLYKTREGWLAPFPWCEEFRFHLDSIFTRLKMVSRKKERGTKTDHNVDMSKIFQPHEECSQPRTVLIEGQPGMGKTTYCNKIAYDWANKCGADYSFLNVQVLLLLRCRDINSDLWGAIDDQLLPKDITEEEKEKFVTFVRNHQSNVLLVLDGLDELPTSKLPVYKEIIQGRMLAKCHLVVTARHEAGIKVRECCDTLLEVEGFTIYDAIDFIRRYFKTEKHLAEKLCDKLMSDRGLQDLVANPLNTALLCLLCEDFQGMPESRTLLFLEIVQCVLRRYRRKKELQESNKDLTELYQAELSHLGCIALKGLHKDDMYFEQSAIENSTSNIIPDFGFLSVQPGRSKRRPSLCYGFLHKSFQELFAGFYLCCQLLDGEITSDSLVADTRYFKELKQVLIFTCGILALRCERKAAELITSIASQVNTQENSDFLCVALFCINECNKEKKKFLKELAKSLGSLLQLQSISCRNLGDSGAAILADVLEANLTVTKLDWSFNGIGDVGAAALAEALKRNSTLTELDLSRNGIGDKGAAALAEAIKTNSSLKVLHFSYNRIGDIGCAALLETMKINSRLTKLDLSRNEMGDSNSPALVENIKITSTPTEFILHRIEISEVGAASLGGAIKIDSPIQVDPGDYVDYDGYGSKHEDYDNDSDNYESDHSVDHELFPDDIFVDYHDYGSEHEDYDNESDNYESDHSVDNELFPDDIFVDYHDYGYEHEDYDNESDNYESDHSDDHELFPYD
ncbi:NLR family CARD domain-containing protein 4-like [Montipora foliosa]|uniref:NLR family CARD domain-containing protein 4-like n=1 Tax=Montipora foliosa TaxID=591990 RepID=UPI0035F1CC0A